MEASNLQNVIEEARTGRGVEIADAHNLQQVILAAAAQGLMAIRVEVSEKQGDLLRPRPDLLLYGLYYEAEIQAASPIERIRLTSQAVDEMLALATREDATFQFELWLDEAADETP